MRPKLHLRRWILLSAAAAAAAALLGAILLVANWPFTEAEVTKALQDRFARDVQIGKFRSTWLPPGCVAEDIRFLHRQRKELPPLITISTLTVRASYSGLFGIGKQVHDVQLAGLHVLVPPKDPRGSHTVFPLTTTTSGKNLTFGAISTDGAVLEFISKDAADRFTLAVTHLTLNNVGEGTPLTFHAVLTNTNPPGEIRSDGQLGPWNEDDPGATQVSGSYTYDHVKLGVFEGLGGTLASQGKFSGTVGHIEAEGKIDVPDFKVSDTGHPVHLTSDFHAIVDGTNGDTALTRVESHFGKTAVISQGDVKGQPGKPGKTVKLTMTVSQGRIEDLLLLVARAARPSEIGDVRFNARLELPPGPQGFLTRLRLDGDFGVGGSFTNPEVQGPLNRLAESAHGETKSRQDVDPATVLSNLKGHVSANAGIATLSGVSFSEPGSAAEIEGTFNLVDKKLNLHGVLHTRGKLADTTSGFKSFVLKALTPFLREKSITEVPFAITGTATDPSFALALTAKR